VIDVRAAAKKLKIAAPTTLDQLLEEGNAAGFNKVVASADKSGCGIFKRIRYYFLDAFLRTLERLSVLD
jgi:hypothetical protein